MATITRTGRLPVPVATAWAALADFGTISAWAGNVDHSCLLNEQPLGVGSARRIQSGRVTVVETVTAWEPEAVLGYEITGLPRVLRSVTNTWRLEEAGADTAATLTTEIDAGTRPPQRAIARAVGRRMGSASDVMLAGLAEHLAGRTEQRP